jgi:hypothetical protein
MRDDYSQDPAPIILSVIIGILCGVVIYFCYLLIAGWPVRAPVILEPTLNNEIIVVLPDHEVKMPALEPMGANDLPFDNDIKSVITLSVPPALPEKRPQFFDVCIKAHQPPKDPCGSAKQIKAAFNVDIATLIEAERRLMVATTQKIIDGSIRTPKDFQVCKRRKECTDVPLLPKGVRAQDVEDSNDFEETRIVFWDLARNSPMNGGICRAMSLCRALSRSGAVSYK